MTVNTSPAEKAVNILVVEDSATQAEQLRYLLEQHSYVVAVANNGTQALEHIGKHTPTLVITDIVMPEMNGYELCQKIKDNEKTRGIPVILLTSLNNSEDVLEGLACGADNFISKPYNKQYLLSNIANILINMKLSKNEHVRVGVEIQIGEKKRFITADQQQMLSMLISTYEAAVNRNRELIQAQDELTQINERLEEMVEERTAELTASEVKFRRLFEAAKDGILILNADTGVVDDVNPFLSQLLGQESEQIVGKKVWELGFINDIIANKANFEELQQKEYIRYEDKPLENDDGERIDVEFVSNIYEVNGRKVIQCNIRDITERKKAEDDLQRQLKELQRWHAVTVDREDRMMELKREVNDLLKEAGRPVKYGG